jgi:hypothetical protein
MGKNVRGRRIMVNFTVIWEVDYYDAEKKFFVREGNTAESLDDLMDDLGENAVDHEPENETPVGLGDFNIEWIMIEDEDGKEVWRDEYYDFENYFHWLEYTS